jgi:hypothetical protein
MKGRIIVILLVAALGALAATSPASAQSTQAFRAEFHDDTTGCPVGVDLCGTGTVQGFGTATTTLTFTGATPGPGQNCLTATADRAVVLDDGSGTLQLAIAGTICAQKIQGTFTIVAGTNVFAGASGGGTLTGVVLPDGGDTVQYRGTISLP